MMIAKAFPWKDYRTFVDVGTAQGDLAAQIALREPASAWAWVRPARSGADLRGVHRGPRRGDRLTFVPGSFFTHDLPKADVVLMGHILHDWDLPTKKMLDCEGLRRRCPSGAPSSSTKPIIDDDAVDERVRADDEPQHAHRDAGRLRLHGGGLRGRGCARPDLRRCGSRPGRAGLDGDRHQIAHPAGCPTRRTDSTLGKSRGRIAISGKTLSTALSNGSNGHPVRAASSTKSVS